MMGTGVRCISVAPLSTQEPDRRPVFRSSAMTLGSPRPVCPGRRWHKRPWESHRSRLIPSGRGDVDGVMSSSGDGRGDRSVQATPARKLSPS